MAAMAGSEVHQALQAAALPLSFLVMSSVLPVVKVLLIAATGLIFALPYFDVLHADARKSLSKLVFTVFLPAIIFVNLGEAISFENLLRWWFIPVNVVLASVLGCLLGMLVAWLTDCPPEFFRLVFVLTGIGNMGNMPLVLLSAVCSDARNPFGGHNECNKLGNRLHLPRHVGACMGACGYVGAFLCASCNSASQHAIRAHVDMCAIRAHVDMCAIRAHVDMCAIRAHVDMCAIRAHVEMCAIRAHVDMCAIRAHVDMCAIRAHVDMCAIRAHVDMCAICAHVDMCAIRAHVDMCAIRAHVDMCAIRAHVDMCAIRAHVDMCAIRAHVDMCAIRAHVDTCAIRAHVDMCAIRAHVDMCAIRAHVDMCAIRAHVDMCAIRAHVDMCAIRAHVDMCAIRAHVDMCAIRAHVDMCAIRAHVDMCAIRAHVDTCAIRAHVDTCAIRAHVDMCAIRAHVDMCAIRAHVDMCAIRAHVDMCAIRAHVDMCAIRAHVDMCAIRAHVDMCAIRAHVDMCAIRAHVDMCAICAHVEMCAIRAHVDMCAIRAHVDMCAIRAHVEMCAIRAHVDTCAIRAHVDACAIRAHVEMCAQHVFLQTVATVMWGMMAAIVMWSTVYNILAPPEEWLPGYVRPLDHFGIDHKYVDAPMVPYQEEEDSDSDEGETDGEGGEEGLGSSVARTASRSLRKASVALLVRAPNTLGEVLKALHIYDVFRPPVLAACLAMLLGMVPQLDFLFFHRDGALRFLTDALAVLGQAMIPCILLVLGANLVKGPGASALPMRTTLAVVVTRLLVVPLLGIAIVLCADRLGLLPPGDKMFRFVLLLQHAMPSSIQIGTACSLRGFGEQEVSAVLFFQHISAVFTMAVYLFVFFYLLYG
ncbi:unnamed protein product [Closterium sp. Yama58-4]|nr:unnamed protein product [Closterium sp. Yama58-4]